jgi:CRISPR-associated protein Cas2
MLVYIVYDIESTRPGNRRRRKIVKKLGEMGLYRIQESVFIGNINKNDADEIAVYCDDLIQESLKKEERDALDDKIYIFPVSKDDFNNVKMIGVGFDKMLVADEILAMVI